eukprot:426185_1
MGSCVTKTQQEHTNYEVIGKRNDNSNHDDNNNEQTYNNDKETSDQQINVTNSQCKSVKDCLSLQRVITCLQYYQKIDIHSINEDKLLLFIQKNQDILNDYHHVLDKHLNEDSLSKRQTDEQFEIIYDRIINENDLICDITQCQVYLRHNRQREKQQIKHVNQCYLTNIDLLDSMHCFFLHSVDIGFRIMHNMNVDANANDNEHIYNDSEMVKLKSFLLFKRQQLESIRGEKRLLNNKFITQIVSGHSGNEFEEETKSPSDDIHYSFGPRYNYWGNNLNHGSPLETKYKSIKDEIIGNMIFSLSIDVFDQAYKKAENLMNNSTKIKSIKRNYAASPYFLRGELNIENVLSIILYTDFDTLSYNFSRTFRKINKHESDNEMTQRHREYSNWSKTLMETVNCYGTMMKRSNVSVYYHGVSLVYFETFISKFNSPTSTTTKLTVAAIFAQNDGIVIEITDGTYGSEYIRHFNCSFISCFGNEDERLFIQPPSRNDGSLYIASIRNISTNESYGDFVTAISKFGKLIKGDENIKMLPVSLQIIESLISNTNNYPNYVSKSFKKWCAVKKQILIVMENSPWKLLQYFLFNGVNNLLRFDKINDVFKNIEQITCIAAETVLDLAKYFDNLLQILTTINEMKFSKLNRICLRRFATFFAISQFEQFEHYQSLFIDKKWKIQNLLYKPEVIASDVESYVPRCPRRDEHLRISKMF